MTPEQIKAKAEELYRELVFSELDSFERYDEGRGKAFTAGAEWMQGEMEKGNPHLLREDGEKEDMGEFLKTLSKRNQELITDCEPEVLPNPRPTDMEQEAREKLEELIKKRLATNTDGWVYIDEESFITALTEFGEMWKERGREGK